MNWYESIGSDTEVCLYMLHYANYSGVHTSSIFPYFSPTCQSLTRAVQGQGELIAAQQRRLEAQVRHAEKT